jgi:hypothetical protein
MFVFNPLQNIVLTSNLPIMCQIVSTAVTTLPTVGFLNNMLNMCLALKKYL